MDAACELHLKTTQFKSQKYSQRGHANKMSGSISDDYLRLKMTKMLPSGTLRSCKSQLFKLHLSAITFCPPSASANEELFPVGLIVSTVTPRYVHLINRIFFLNYISSAHYFVYDELEAAVQSQWRRS